MLDLVKTRAKKTTVRKTRSSSQIAKKATPTKKKKTEKKGVLPSVSATGKEKEELDSEDLVVEDFEEMIKEKGKVKGIEDQIIGRFCTSDFLVQISIKDVEGK